MDIGIREPIFIEIRVNLIIIEWVIRGNTRERKFDKWVWNKNRGIGWGK